MTKKFTNYRELYEALFNGTIVSDSNYKYRFSPEQGIEYTSLSFNLENWSYLQSALEADPIEEYKVYVNPNLFQKGTYTWANEEHKQGKTIWRAAWSDNQNKITIWPKDVMPDPSHEDAVAQDWLSSEDPEFSFLHENAYTSSFAEGFNHMVSVVNSAAVADAIKQAVTKKPVKKVTKKKLSSKRKR
jgi:hypothetical protein